MQRGRDAEPGVEAFPRLHHGKQVSFELVELSPLGRRFAASLADEAQVAIEGSCPTVRAEEVVAEKTLHLPGECGDGGSHPIPRLFFGLLHTHFGSDGDDDERELVRREDGQNCSEAGDLLCDTPADPGPVNRNEEEGCRYEVTSPCRIDSCGSDPTGDGYGSTREFDEVAFLGNVMSYYEDLCNVEYFTVGQSSRIMCVMRDWIEESDAFIGVDLDGDGYEALSPDAPEGSETSIDGLVDCDDTNPDIHPGADEVCDELGVDEDCDGEVNEDSAINADPYVPDSDGDGQGDASQLDSPSYFCTPPAGWVPLLAATDCDDTDDLVYQGALESCETPYDDDCDGDVNEGDAVDALVQFEDADEDGYGNATVTTRDCIQQSGYVLNALDCDDSNDARNPSEEESCDTPYDDDCDLLVNDNDPGVIDAEVVGYPDLDGDGYGDESAGEYYCASSSMPSSYVTTGGDCDDLDSSLNPSELDPCDGVDNDCSGLIDDGSGSSQQCPCDMGWYDGHAYMYCDVGLTFTAADSACSNNGYRLATVDTSSEFTEITSNTGTLNSGGHWWIGLRDTTGSGNWTWVATGTAPKYPAGTGTTSYTSWPWAGGEPNNSSERCVELDGGRTHLWNDEDCDHSQGYVCEAGP